MISLLKILFSKKYQFLLPEKARFKFIVLFFLMIISTNIEIIGITAVLPLVGVLSTIEVDKIKETYNFLNLFNLEKKNYIIFLLFIIVVAYIFKNFFIVVYNYILHKFCFEVRFHSAKNLFKEYLNTDFKNIKQKNPATIIRNIEDISAAVRVIVLSSLNICAETFLIIFIFAILLIASFDAVIFLFFSSLFIFLLYKFFLKNKILKTGKNTLSISGYIKRVILITISAIKEIKIYGREKKLENLFNNYFINLQKNNLKYVMYNLLPKLILELYGVFLFFLFFLFFLSKHEVSDVLPIISLYIIAFIRLLPSSAKILNSLQSVEFHKPHFKILIDEFKHYFFHNRGSKKNETNPLLLDNQKFFIELKNVSSEYDGKKILNDINLKIYKNKIIWIKGESGSGKTTLVDIISGLVKPSKGECNLVVNNKKISLFNNFNFLRQFISLTPQKVILFNETIKENILFGNQNKKLFSPQYSQFKNLFKYSDLENFYKKNKKRKVGFMGSSISGGQIQRIGISRTLFKNRNIMIFDEPTSSLNYEISTKIYKHLNTIKLGKIIIIISHDNNIDKYCDEVYVLKNAKLTKKLN